jgi:hypothetical protein
MTMEQAQSRREYENEYENENENEEAFNGSTHESRILTSHLPSIPGCGRRIRITQRLQSSLQVPS